MKHRMTVVTNTVHTSWGQFTYSTEADTVLRYRILWMTTFECRQHASVTQLKTIYKMVNWVAFSSTLFGVKFIIIGIECKTMKFIERPLFTCSGREIVLLIGPYSCMLFMCCICRLCIIISYIPNTLLVSDSNCG